MSIEKVGEKANLEHKPQQQPEKRGRDRCQFSITSVLILSTVTLASIGVLAFLLCGATIKQKLDEEVFKLSYQFLLIVVGGGAVSLLYKQFSTERDEAQERRVLLRQMHSELLNAFNTAKRVRRTLRARARYFRESDVTSPLIVNAKDYKEQMNILMDAQLTFEVYAKRAKESQLFFARGEELQTACRKVEEYLNDIIKEYEDNLREPLNKYRSLVPCLEDRAVRKLRFVIFLSSALCRRL